MVSISQPGDLARAVVVAATCLVSLSNTSNSAEFGASPCPKGFRDIYAGVVPTVPGLYVLNDTTVDDLENLISVLQANKAFLAKAVSQIDTKADE